jgi:hypothetical protein
MGRRLVAEARLSDLLQMAVGFCQQADRATQRTGAGRPCVYPPWLLASLIMVAVLKRRKSKTAQYRFLEQHRATLLALLGVPRLPSRATYFARYARTHGVFEVAIRLQCRRAVRERIVDVSSVAVDKSVLTALGPAWHKKAQAAGRVPRGGCRGASIGKLVGRIQGTTAGRMATRMKWSFQPEKKGPSYPCWLRRAEPN